MDPTFGVNPFPGTNSLDSISAFIAKSCYRKYAEPRRINEIANHKLTTNQKAGGSNPSGRSK